MPCSSSEHALTGSCPSLPSAHRSLAVPKFALSSPLNVVTQTCNSRFIRGGADSPSAHRSITVPQAHSPSAHLRCRLCRLTLTTRLRCRRLTLISPLNCGATGSLTLSSPLTTCGTGSHSTMVQARPWCTLTTHMRCRRLTLNSPLTCGGGGAGFNTQRTTHVRCCTLTLSVPLTCGAAGWP